jgi:hypothetical protein
VYNTFSDGNAKYEASTTEKPRGSLTRTTENLLSILSPYYKLGRLLLTVKLLAISEASLQFNPYPANVEYKVSS